MKALEPARLATSRPGLGVEHRGVHDVAGWSVRTWVNSVNVRVGGSSIGNRGHDVSRVRVGYRRRTVGVTRWSNEHARRSGVFSP